MSLRKTKDDQFPALKVSWMLKKENWRKNSLTNQEPRSERNSPCYKYPCSSQSFPSDKTAGVSSKTFIVKNIPNSLTHTVASPFVCTSQLAVITVVGLLDVVTVSNSTEFKSLFADHVHRRSRIYNKFSFRRFNS